ncbi:MAG: 30S ribosomal protein S20 [Pirellulaceae bacterium]
MPNTKSAKKRLKQSEERRGRNRSARTILRSQLRRVRESAAGGSIDQAQDEFKAATRCLDKAGAHRLIHPNKAARLKSRLSKMIKKAKGA